MTVNTHGSSGYTRGCRCQICTEDRAEYQRNYLKKKKELAFTEIEHGTWSAYHLSKCRCDDCVILEGYRRMLKEL